MAQYFKFVQYPNHFFMKRAIDILHVNINGHVNTLPSNHLNCEDAIEISKEEFFEVYTKTIEMLII